MIIKQLIDEDFTNYKKPSMFIGFPNCTWKCEKDCGKKMCQNKELATSPSIEIEVDNLVNRYLNNIITKAVVCGGLEPMDSWNDIQQFIKKLREYTDDDCVIYTGYYPEEIQDNINWLKQFSNIIIKFGRFIPNHQPHYDEILGVDLISDNQQARRIS